MTTREHIAPDWTLGQLKDTFPGVELTLFAYFGVGSRERAGFAAAETLGDLLRRHLVFDADTACRRLDALAAEDWQNEVIPLELRQQMETGGVAVIDARSQEDFSKASLAGSKLLSAASVAELRGSPATPVVVVCNDGSQAPAASRHLRSLGLSAGHLKGGLCAWSIDVDESFPINYPLTETPGCWHLLADSRTLRYRRPSACHQHDWRLWRRAEIAAHPVLQPLTAALPELELIAASPRTFAARGDFPNHTQVIKALLPWLSADEWSGGGETSSPPAERALLEQVLAVEAATILKSHKGTVEVEDYVDRVLHLRLGGGCAGCASASITTQRELAAALYRDVPLLDRIVGS